LVAAAIANAANDWGSGYLPWLDLAPTSIPGIWARWDSGYYLVLAEQGYAAIPNSMGFFPLYPLLMRGLSYVTGMGLPMSGLMISHFSYLVTILGFYRLARVVRDDHVYAMRSTTYLVFFPSSFFFFAIYAESLSLAFSVLGVLAVLLTPPKYIRAGMALCLASAARPMGWLLDIVPVVEFLRRGDRGLRTCVSLAGGLVLSVMGVVLYVAYLYASTGTFLAIPQAQAGWQRHWDWPWTTLWHGLQMALSPGVSLRSDWFLYISNLIDLSFTLLAIALTAVAVVRSIRGSFRWSLSIALIGSLIFLTSSHGVERVPLWGMTRWVAALFPLYLVVGDLSQNKTINLAIGVISAAFLVLLTAWWASGRWVG
jgi:Gpi18-like mannosyltransferase